MRFQSGWWEQALCGVCVSTGYYYSNPFGWLLLQAQLVSSHKWADQNSGEYLRGPPLQMFVCLSLSFRVCMWCVHEWLSPLRHAILWDVVSLNSRLFLSSGSLSGYTRFPLSRSWDNHKPHLISHLSEDGKLLLPNAVPKTTVPCLICLLFVWCLFQLVGKTQSLLLHLVGCRNVLGSFSRGSLHRQF